ALPAGYVTNDTDCDDSDDAFHPGATEADCADPADYNCDGSVGYADADGDGFAACQECDDSRADVNPDAPEVCDEADNDCNGLIDEDAADAPAWHLDADHDGYGDPAMRLSACVAPEGYVSDSSDCDDLHALSFPGGGEVCDGHDNDCDGTVDVGASDAQTWYADGDGDQYGDPDQASVSCEAPEGAVLRGSDCDDTHAAARPGGTEVCDGLDNDCDGAVDVDAVDARTWYGDGDGDGYGDSDQVTVACEAPQGAVLVGGDCDDAHAAARPGGNELCDGLDNDCDGEIDDSATDAGTWYADGDGDGYGDLRSSERACAQPVGYVADSRDCDDAEGAAHPGAAETCADSFDNDCDGQINEADAGDAAVWHLDADRDGFGRPGVGLRACETPDGYVASATDCDDLDQTVFPGAPQRCDGLANDCDAGLPADESDADGDGHMACEGDCDDGLAGVYPGANEHCDGVDEDCDGLIDDSAVDQTVWHLDLDGDGYGQAFVTRTQCLAPDHFVADGEDCDDADPTTNPGEREIPGNDKDDSCDGEDLPLLVFAGARFSGQLWAIDYYSGETAWIAEGLPELLDLAVGTDGTVYAAAIDEGVVAVASDGTSSWQVLTGYAGISGLWFDASTDTLLVTSFAGDLLEVDPASGAVTELSVGNAESLKDVVRFEGEDTLYVTADSALRAYDPTADTWTDVATFSRGAWGLLPDDRGGFWVGGANADMLMHAALSGAVRYQHTGLPNHYGLCADPTGGGLVGVADHVAGVFALDPATGLSEQLNLDALDQPFSCGTNGLRDQDGDGFLARAQGGDDCDDADALVFPGASDPFGDGVDGNCDGVDGLDGDGDGVPVDAIVAICADQDDADPAVGVDPTCVLSDCAETLAVRGVGTPSGVYPVDPNGDGDLSDALQVYCEMELAGGGWTLVANRRANTVNIESCGSNLAQFFTGGCGSPDAITAADSYALSAAQRARFAHTQFMQVQYLDGALDGDDGFIFDYDGEAFPNTNASTNIPVAQVCDLSGTYCDSTQVFWKYIGDYWFHSAQCFSGSSSDTSHRGNYGICHNDAYNGGNASAYPTDSFNGDRNEYSQAKLWNHVNTAAAYQERMYFR
ncbi:MAG: hypothetical protein JXX28_16585, partial [Deltaproteobacteria bacterium]|nr:hypothetical protein [Deltaproteobacteria bacterium]